MTSFTEALALADIRRASDADVPVDDTGFAYSRFVPEDRIEVHECAVWETDHIDGVTRCVECDAWATLPTSVYN